MMLILIHSERRFSLTSAMGPKTFVLTRKMYLDLSTFVFF